MPAKYLRQPVRFLSRILRKASRTLTAIETRLSDEPDTSTRYTFVDRSHKAERLVLIICGYKPMLWRFTLPRVARFANNQNIDICIVCPGASQNRVSVLQSYAATYGWSFFYMPRNNLALSQNIAIGNLFTNARLIAKLDEDIFVTEGWFERLEQTLERAESDGNYWVGFVAPLMPVNGYGYRVFLNTENLMEEYHKKFPHYWPPISACMGVGAHFDPDVCEWLWRKSYPLDKVARKFADRDIRYSICPHRFSIGAILFRREVWEQIGGFEFGPDGTLGVEERQLCITSAWIIQK